MTGTCRRTRRFTVLGAIFSSAIFLASCSSDTEPQEEPPASEEAPEAEDDEGGEEPDQDLPVTALDVDPADVVGEESYTLPGTDDEVTVGVLPLEVKGDIMILRVIFTPNFESASDDEVLNVGEMYPDDSFKFLPQLIDYDNLKQYNMLDNTGDYWQPSTRALETVNGQPVDWWGVYPAPEDDIDSFDVQLREGMPTFEGVPIQ